MSEVDKMYGNAGVKTDRVVCYRGFDNCIDNDFNCHCHNEKPCKDATKIYPPFTAEKQIELIKWLILNYSTEITKGRYTNYFMSTGRSYKASGNDDLIICMANLINNLWQDLTEEEKQQVKGILE